MAGVLGDRSGALRRLSFVSKLPFTAACLIVIACQLMSASIQHAALPKFGANVVASFVGPVEVLHHEATRSILRLWEHYVWLQGVEAERGSLLSRVKELEALNSRLVEFQHENLRLRELLRYSTENQRAGIAASVVGRDPSNWSNTIALDRGANDGVRQGFAVVDGNAVVGQVVAAAATTSRVLLVTDPTSAIDAIVQNSRARGIVEGVSDRSLRLRYVLKEFAVSVGDRVIASGLDGIYPKGTLLGVVTKVDQSENGLFQSVELQPSISPKQLESVLVLLPVPANSVEPPVATSSNVVGYPVRDPPRINLATSSACR